MGYIFWKQKKKNFSPIFFAIFFLILPYSTKDLRNKITVSFSSSELKSSSIKVSVIREIYENQNWVSDGYSDGLARKIEDLILSRAREIRNN